MANERDDVIVLVNENGEEESFRHLDTIEMNDNKYVVLSPLSQYDDGGENDEVEDIVILKLQQGDDGEDTLVVVEEDDEIEAVFEEFRSRVEDEYDFLEDLEEEDSEEIE